MTIKFMKDEKIESTYRLETDLLLLLLLFYSSRLLLDFCYFFYLFYFLWRSLCSFLDEAL